MKLIIGIIFGLFIIFNWSKIKETFDSAIANQAQQSGAVQPVTPAQTAPGFSTTHPHPPAQPVVPQSLASSVEQRLKNAVAGK